MWVTNGSGDNTLINWDLANEDTFVTKTRDQPEPGSFFPHSLWGGEMEDPGNEVEIRDGFCCSGFFVQMANLSRQCVTKLFSGDTP